jgi:hypothetical protein
MMTETSDPPPVTGSGTEVIESLVDLWIHHNTLMWGRIQLLSAMQGAVIAANYVLKSGRASISLVLILIIETLYLNYIWEVDRLIRDSYNDRLRDLGFKVNLTSEERRRLQIKVIGVQVPAHMHAQIALRAIFWGMLVVDAVVLIVSVAVFPW